MSFNYRFSVIPAGAIVDDRLTPRALQVLCLLGRHTNDQGWCSRSQVKMARELKCGRSTVQDAIECLVETGWVEKRANGRGGRAAPVEGEQQFSAYSYRVKLDRDDVADGRETSSSSDDGGAGIAAGGAGTPAGGAGSGPAPLEGSSSEGIPSEPERETRARAREHERFAKWLSQFVLRWPTAAADDQSRTANAARSLTDDERDDALAKIPEFLAHLGKIKRDRVPAGWRYLEEKRWTLLAAEAQKTATGSSVALEGTTQFSIGMVVLSIAKNGQSLPSFILSGPYGQRQLRLFNKEFPEALAAIPADRSLYRPVLRGSGEYASWMRWLAEWMPPTFIMPTESKGQRALMVPGPYAPRVDGTCVLWELAELTEERC